MSTTKPDTDTGWSDKYPHKSGAGDEYYFVRRKDRNDVVIMGFSMGKAWLNGVSYEPTEMRSHLFLGPISPSDFEQLLRLRRAATLYAIPYEALLMDSESRRWIAPEVWTAIENAVAALREALARTGEKS